MPANDKPPTGDIGETGSPPAGDVVMIYVTFPDRETALRIGRGMVEAGFAGCVNILPAMTSIYIWKGVIETSEEAVMIAKLAAEAAPRAVDHILAQHPYDTPAVLVIPVIGGNEAYLHWVRGGTRC